ncbi:MAG: hypothetical protein GEU91_13995 [Rhizobiales bacterium]|nr:hypothetical protein [Hyphomicrobiales bacterium]
MTDLFAFADAKSRRDAGMAQAEQHGSSFAWRAYHAIEALAFNQPTVHVDDVLRQGVREPHHSNAWGAVWMRAIRSGLIERTSETRPCTRDPKKHAHRYPVYRSLVFGGRS